MSIMNQIPTIVYIIISNKLVKMYPPATIKQVKSNNKEYGETLTGISTCLLIIFKILNL